MFPRAVVQTWPAGACTEEELVQHRAKAGYTFTESSEPFLDVVFEIAALGACLRITVTRTLIFSRLWDEFKD